MSPPPKRNLFFELGLPFSIVQVYRNRKRWTEGLTPLSTPHPIIVIPGLGAGDGSTRALRGFLRYIGLWVHGWKQGINHGRVGRILPKVIEHVITISKRHNAPVILIGWSLGGLISREISRQISEHVHAVCCMGSPLVGGPTHTIYARLYERTGSNLEEMAELIAKRESVPLTVPCHILYSKRDGIVHWEACIDQYNEHTTHKEIKTPHFSMGTSQEVFDELYRWVTKITLNM